MVSLSKKINILVNRIDVFQKHTINKNLYT